MHKKLTILFFTFLFGLQSINAESSINQKYNQNNVVIVWDFHDVLVQKNWWSMFQRMGAILKKSESPWNLIKIIPSILYDAYKLQGTCSSSEELVDTFLKKYPQLASHKNELLLVINQHEPIKKSVQILEQLKKEGYHNYLASNIGKNSLEIMQQRYPNIFNQLDGYYIPHTQRLNGNYHLIAKPCIEYYRELRLYLKSQGISDHYTIIFIDDNIDNIESANKSNLKIKGIHFTSPEQLKAELEEILQNKQFEKQ